MSYKSFVSLALASSFFLPSPAMAESLRDAVIKALEQHPTLEAAQAVEDRIDQERREQRAGFFPEVRASATGGRIFGDNSTTRGLTVTRGEAYSYLWEGSAAITQPIFDGMQTFNKVDAASARLAAQEYTVSDIRENLALRAVQAYFNLLRSQMALDSIRNYQETLRAYQDQITMMVNEGAADEAEAAQAKNISLLLQSALADFTGQVESAKAEYLEITGRAPETPLNIPDGIDEKTFQYSAEEAVEYAKRNHPILLSVQKELEATAHDSEVEEGALFPELDGELSYLKRDQKEEIGGEAVDGRAVLRMNWDFSLGGAELARIRQTKAKYSEALANLHNAQREVVRDVRRAYALYESSKKRHELLKERQKITADLFDTYKVQFEGARISMLQLMQTENQMFNTKLEAINTHFEYLTTHYSVLASMGDLLKSLNLNDTSVPVFENVGPVYPKQDQILPALDQNLGQVDVIPLEETVDVYPDKPMIEQTIPVLQTKHGVPLDTKEAAIETQTKVQPVVKPNMKAPTPGLKPVYPIEDYAEAATLELKYLTPAFDPAEKAINEKQKTIDKPFKGILIKDQQEEGFSKKTAEKNKEQEWPTIQGAGKIDYPQKTAVASKESVYPIEDYYRQDFNVWPVRSSD